MELWWGGCRLDGRSRRSGIEAENVCTEFDDPARVFYLRFSSFYALCLQLVFAPQTRLLKARIQLQQRS